MINKLPASIAQWIEQLTPDQQAKGSTPFRCAKKLLTKQSLCDTI